MVQTLKDGDCFGEIGLLISVPRTASIRAKTLCDLFVLEKSSFSRILRDHPQFAKTISTIAKERYDINLSSQQFLD